MSARWLLLIHRCLNFIVTAILGIGLLGTLSSCSDSGSNSVQLTPSEQATNSQNSVRPCSIVVGRLNGADGGLFAAVESGDSVRVQRAIDEGAQVNATDVLKRTPLAVASFCNRPEIVRLLIDRGANVNAIDFDGMTPLHAAVVLGDIEVAKVLIERKADLNIRDSAGHSPLLLAVAGNYPALTEMLLDHGANTHLRDQDGNTAISLAADNGYKNISAILKKR